MQMAGGGEDDKSRVFSSLNVNVIGEDDERHESDNILAKSNRQ